MARHVWRLTTRLRTTCDERHNNVSNMCARMLDSLSTDDVVYPPSRIAGLGRARLLLGPCSCPSCPSCPRCSTRRRTALRRPSVKHDDSWHQKGWFRTADILCVHTMNIEPVAVASRACPASMGRSASELGSRILSCSFSKNMVGVTVGCPPLALHPPPHLVSHPLLSSLLAGQWLLPRV
jgi:hypothetical protein